MHSRQQPRRRSPGSSRPRDGRSAYEFAVGSRWPRLVLAALFLMVLVIESGRVPTIRFDAGSTAEVATCNTTTVDMPGTTSDVVVRGALAAFCGTTTTRCIFGLCTTTTSNCDGPCPTTTTTSTTRPKTHNTNPAPTTTVTTVPPTTATTSPPTTKALTKPPPTRPPPTKPPATSAPVTAAPTTTAPTTTPLTTLPTVATPPVGTPNRALILSRQAVPPGGAVTATGQGCSPNSPVTLSIDSALVGNTVANDQGSFSTPLTASLAIGQHTVTALCGPTLEATLDVVLTSQAGPPTSTAAIMLIMFLIGLVVIRWELSSRNR